MIANRNINVDRTGVVASRQILAKRSLRQNATIAKLPPLDLFALNSRKPKELQIRTRRNLKNVRTISRILLDTPAGALKIGFVSKEKKDKDSQHVSQHASQTDLHSFKHLFIG